MSEMRDWLRANGYQVGERGRIRPEHQAAFLNRAVQASESHSEVVVTKPAVVAQPTPASVSESRTDPSRRCRNTRCQCPGFLKGATSNGWVTCANCHDCEQTHAK